MYLDEGDRGPARGEACGRDPCHITQSDNYCKIARSTLGLTFFETTLISKFYHNLPNLYKPVNYQKWPFPITDSKWGCSRQTGGRRPGALRFSVDRTPGSLPSKIISFPLSLRKNAMTSANGRKLSYLPAGAKAGRLPRHSIFIFTSSPFLYNPIGPHFISNPPESLSLNQSLFLPHLAVIQAMRGDIKLEIISLFPYFESSLIYASNITTDPIPAPNSIVKHPYALVILLKIRNQPEMKAILLTTTMPYQTIDLQDGIKSKASPRYSFWLDLDEGPNFLSLMPFDDWFAFPAYIINKLDRLSRLYMYYDELFAPLLFSERITKTFCISIIFCTHTPHVIVVRNVKIEEMPAGRLHSGTTTYTFWFALPDFTRNCQNKLCAGTAAYIIFF